MIPYWKQYIDENDVNSVIEVLKSNYLTTWPKVEEFEKKVCEYTKVKYCVSCWNWTQALHLAYEAIWLKYWDEVITTANTFVATSNMILQVWAIPVFCDINLETYNIDEDKIEKLINPKTKAISVVHFAWKSCNMKKIWNIAKENNLKVIEDWAHALWAEYNWEKIWNSQSDVITFSFHPVKPITTWEWWCVVTNNEEYYKKMKNYRWHGIQRDENGLNNMIDFWSNYRICDIQCALWVSQLSKIDSFMKKRRNIAKLYNQLLIKSNKIFLPITDTENNKSWWHLYVIRFEDKKTRDKVMDILKSNWYWVTLHYPPVYTHTYYRNNWYRDFELDNCNIYYKTCLSLPIFFELEEKEIRDICNLIIKNI